MRQLDPGLARFGGFELLVFQVVDVGDLFIDVEIREIVFGLGRGFDSTRFGDRLRRRFGRGLQVLQFEPVTGLRSVGVEVELAGCRGMVRGVEFGDVDLIGGRRHAGFQLLLELQRLGVGLVEDEDAFQNGARVLGVAALERRSSLADEILGTLLQLGLTGFADGRFRRGLRVAEHGIDDRARVGRLRRGFGCRFSVGFGNRLRRVPGL